MHNLQLIVECCTFLNSNRLNVPVPGTKGITKKKREVDRYEIIQLCRSNQFENKIHSFDRLYDRIERMVESEQVL